MTDTAGILDIDPYLTSVRNGRQVAERVIVSLLHSRGTLWWAPERGYDLRDALHSNNDADLQKEMIQAEAEADPLVDSAEVEIEVLGDAMQVSVHLFLNDGSESELEITVDSIGDILNADITG